MNQALIEDVVSEVVRQLGRSGRIGGGVRAGEDAPANARRPAQAHTPDIPSGRYGIYADVDQAVSAATEAQRKLMRLSLDDRDRIVKRIKSMAKANAQRWGRMELDETGVGRLDHKIEKLEILELVPGVEFLKTNADSGTNGVCLEEFAPFGVIGAITPVTHSIPTLTANAINMLAAGNSMVVNAHPSGVNCAAHAAAEYNKAIAKEFGIENLITCVVPPTMESADAIFKHRGVPLLVVTGGPGVARAALAAKKRAIVAGPGNPPVVVDETADLKNTAESLIKGAAYDNNLLCIGEKEVFCVDSVFDQLLAEMGRYGGHVLNAKQIEALTRVAFEKDPNDGKEHVNKKLVGKDAAVLGEAAGFRVPPTAQLLVGETSADHPFVQHEQMMPFLPFVRVRNVQQAIEAALQAEHGFRHTALIHSRNTQTITEFGRLAATTLFVVNGASMAGLGLGGQGYLSYSIATPTGEGITTPLTFTRFRRMMLTGALRMV